MTDEIPFLYLYMIIGAIVIGYQLRDAETARRADGSDILYAMFCGVFWPIWVIFDLISARDKAETVPADRQAGVIIDVREIENGWNIHLRPNANDLWLFVNERDFLSPPRVGDIATIQSPKVLKIDPAME